MRLPPKPIRDRFVDALSDDELAFLQCEWRFWARDDQLPPDDPRFGAAAKDWRVWLILGGRGAGKTRTGAEWVRMNVAAGVKRLGLIAETMADARDVMVEGPSGLLSIHRRDERPRHEPSKRRLVWPNGATAGLFSAEDPDSLRGHQFEAAWCDELCKWRRPQQTWDMLQFGLRLGARPRCVATTTPRPIPLLRRIMEEEGNHVSRSAMSANRDHLAPGFVEAMIELYEGTRLGRQEIDGEILDDDPDALWRREDIDRLRVAVAPDLRRIVVAVDPPATSGDGADACGIVVAGVDEDGVVYILADLTSRGLSPMGWGRGVIEAWRRYRADCIVVEVNQGGELVRELLRQIDPDAPIRQVFARRAKGVRAEPVAALYERGRVRHVGRLDALEDAMCAFSPFAARRQASELDRIDALVWAATDLALSGASGAPRIHAL